MLLEGSGTLLTFGGTLESRLEAGLRHYAADAESGAGFEIDFSLGADRLWYPHAAADAGTGSRAMRLGLKFTSGWRLEAGSEFGRREQAPGNPPEEAVLPLGQIRFRAAVFRAQGRARSNGQERRPSGADRSFSLFLSLFSPSGFVVQEGGGCALRCQGTRHRQGNGIVRGRKTICHPVPEAA